MNQIFGVFVCYILSDDDQLFYGVRVRGLSLSSLRIREYYCNFRPLLSFKIAFGQFKKTSIDKCQLPNVTVLNIDYNSTFEVKMKP